MTENEYIYDAVLRLWKDWHNLASESDTVTISAAYNGYYGYYVFKEWLEANHGFTYNSWSNFKCEIADEQKFTMFLLKYVEG